jgi:hypothetical protein
VGSRLLGAIVKVGISLGTTTGCLGQTHDNATSGEHIGNSDAGTDDDSTSDTNIGSTGTGWNQPSTSAQAGASSDGNSLTGSGGAAASSDALGSGQQSNGGSASNDATSASGSGGDDSGVAGAGGVSGHDPFCDATWPTTKGNPDPPSCIDPNLECIDAGPVMRCATVAPNRACADPILASLCIDATWVCPEGSVLLEDCWCWGHSETMVCTEHGWQPLED